MFRFWFTALVASFLVITPAAADIVVIPNIINFNAADLPRTDVVVTNEGNEDAYIKVVPNIVVAPGTAKEHKSIIRDPEQSGLLVTPQQFIIPPHQRHLVRFMLTRPLAEDERIYRVDIMPVANNLIANSSKNRPAKTVGIKLLVGYEVLAMARPVNPQWNIIAHRENNTLFLQNKGNTNVFVSDIEQCTGKHCESLKRYARLYAGNTKQIPLKFSSPAAITAYYLDEKKTLTSN